MPDDSRWFNKICDIPSWGLTAKLNKKMDITATNVGQLISCAILLCSNSVGSEYGFSENTKSHKVRQLNEKTCLCHMRTTNVQISLRTHGFESYPVENPRKQVFSWRGSNINIFLLSPTGMQEVEGSIFGSIHISCVEIWIWNKIYGHSLPIADSNRATVVYWRMYGHLG